MEKPEVIRVWGKADEIELEFSHAGGAEWKCSVPPDTVDGQYSTEIYAMNAAGEFAYWTGFLYMCNGVCHLEIHQSPYRIRVKEAHRRIVQFCPSKTRIEIRKRCIHYAG